MWNIYFQAYKMNGKDCAIGIFKNHHMFADGASSMSMCLAMSSEYDRSYFVGSGDVPYIMRLFTRLSFPFMIPYLIYESLCIRKDDNFMTKNKENLSGIINISCNSELLLSEVKSLSKKIGVTINDLISTAVSIGLQKILKEKGETPNQVQICIPANVRFEFYPTREDVKMENKFAAIPLKLPLVDNMEKSYKSIAKLMKKNVKENYLAVYASYASAFYSNMILPRVFTSALVDKVTSNFMLGFSNVAGPIKPMFYENENKTKKYYCNKSTSFFNCSGNVGTSICCMSFCKHFTIGISSDNNVMDKVTQEKFCRYIYESLKDE